MQIRTLLLAGAAVFSAAAAQPALAAVRLESGLQWSFQHSDPDQGNGAEINAFDPGRQEIYVTGARGVDVLDRNGNYLRTLRISDTNGEVASVSVKGNVVAIAGQVGETGRVRFFTTSGAFIRDVAVGIGPDSIAFTPDGARLLVAIEGEPDMTDPMGGIAIVNVADGSVSTLGFEGFESQKVALQAKGALFRPGTNFAEDIEPEFVAISADGQKAFVTLQENNLIAVVDLSGGSAKIDKLISAGLKDVSTAENAFIHRTSAAIPTSEGLTGITALRQPDGISTFVHEGVTYIVTADEGEDLGNNQTLPYDASLPQSSIDAIDSLNQRRRFWGLDLDNDGDADTISYSGGRSVSIRTEDGTVVWDAGNLFEKAVTELGLLGLNSDRRNGLSIEPENLVVGTIGGRRWLFVGVERGRSIATFDISNPLAPVFNGLIFDTSVGNAFNNFEGLSFISGADSWDGNAYLLASAEDEGWTHLFRLNVVPEPASWAMMITGFGLVGGMVRRRRAKAVAA
jgi:hypothetical protein